MKTYISIALISLLSLSSFSQSVDKSTELNGITLGVNQSEFSGDLFLITGDEPAYQEAPSLQYTLKRNIKLGIRDASYQGDDYRKFEKYEASYITMQFYQGELFKVQWTFRSRESLKEIYDYLVDRNADKFGASKEEVYDDFRQVEWQGGKKYVQVFMDPDSDVTLVYEDVKVARKVQKVISKSK